MGCPDAFVKVDGAGCLDIVIKYQKRARVCFFSRQCAVYVLDPGISINNIILQPSTCISEFVSCVMESVLVSKGVPHGS